MNIFRRVPEPTCEEQLEQLRERIRELEFTIAKNPCKFDAVKETVEIGQLTYSYRLFEALGSFLPLGVCFELVDRAGGSITIRQIVTEIDARRVLREVIEREKKRAADFAKIDLGSDPFHGS